jgi:hypothetical protein
MELYAVGVGFERVVVGARPVGGKARVENRA